MKTWINDWRAHQRKAVCTVQEYLARRPNEKHLMFDTQDKEGGAGLIHFWLRREKLAMLLLIIMRINSQSRNKYDDIQR